MGTLVVHDQTGAGRPEATVSLPGLPERITVRELVRLRVREEFAWHNADPAALCHALVLPPTPRPPRTAATRSVNRVSHSVPGRLGAPIRRRAPAEPCPPVRACRDLLPRRRLRL